MSLKKVVSQMRNMYHHSGMKRTVDKAFGEHLLMTNTVSSGVLMFLGDIVQQEIEYQRKMLPKRYDWARLTRMTILGCGYGPIHHYFYEGIHKLWPMPTVKHVMKKVLTDQLFMSPFCIAYFFYSAGLLEFKSLQACTDELKDKFVEVYLVDWCVWPAAQFLNFYYLPLKYHVLYINTITTVYNVFLSYMKHRELAYKHLEETLLKQSL